MSFSNQNTSQVFPYKYDLVFTSLLKVLKNEGFSVKDSDETIGRIFASSGWSLFSYGENITLIVEKKGEDQCVVDIDSSLKVGMNIAGGHRHSKNFNKIIMALSKFLKKESDV